MKFMGPLSVEEKLIGGGALYLASELFQESKCTVNFNTLYILHPSFFRNKKCRVIFRIKKVRANAKVK